MPALPTTPLPPADDLAWVDYLLGTGTSKLTEIIEELERAFKPDGTEFEPMISDDSDLIFPDPLGRPARPSTVADLDLQNVFKKAGLPARCFTFHSLRHYAVTQARRVGKLDLLVCQKIAGHSSPDITLKIYSHLFSSDIADAADAFDPFKEAVNA